MFIYSNHYLIISKLTHEDCKEFFTDVKVDNIFSEIDETEYYWHECIDLSLYEIESSNFVDIEDADSDEDSIIVEKSLFEFDHFDLYKNYYFIHDKFYYSTDADPYIEFDMIIPYDQGFLPKEKEARDPTCKEYAIKNEPNEILNYSEEDLQNNRIFPKNNYVYDLNDKTYDYTADHDHWEEDDSGEINFNISADCCIDNDSSEYWSEPLFVFACIREMHFFRKKDDHFKSSFLAVNSDEWFDRREYDTNTERDNYT